MDSFPRAVVTNDLTPGGCIVARFWRPVVRNQGVGSPVLLRLGVGVEVGWGGEGVRVVPCLVKR